MDFLDENREKSERDVVLVHTKWDMRNENWFLGSLKIFKLVVHGGCVFLTMAIL